MEVYGKDEKMKIGIIGLGLIGGSMAIDLKRRGFADSLTGVEADSVNAAAAQKIGLVDRVVSLEECVRECELIVLAVPVGSAVRMLPEILDMFRAEENTAGVCRKTVLDVCSTKEQLAKTVHYHPMRTHYVATHPMAGTEYSGPWAAMSGLFDGRACIICDQEESAPSSVHLAEKLYGEHFRDRQAGVGTQGRARGLGRSAFPDGIRRRCRRGLFPWREIHECGPGHFRR